MRRARRTLHDKFTLHDKLWEAMLVVFPAIVVQDLKQAPSGCAQLVKEHAEALLNEWMRVEFAYGPAVPPAKKRATGQSA